MCVYTLYLPNWHVPALSYLLMADHRLHLFLVLLGWTFQFLFIIFWSIIDLLVVSVSVHNKVNQPYMSMWWRCSRQVVSDSCNPVDCSLPGSSFHGIRVHTSPLFKILSSVNWNVLRCMPYQWTSLFQTQVSEPRWNTASYLEVISYFLPSKCWGAGGAEVRGSSATSTIS